MRILQYIFCIFLFVGTSIAETININWIDGSTTYAQTTCTVGGDVILPATPTKRGYTFDGWITRKVYSDNIDLPAEYERLKYIESTGEQYIDTRISVSSLIRIDVNFKTLGNNGAVFGIYEANNQKGHNCVLYSMKNTGIYTYDNDKDSSNIILDSYNTNSHTVSLDLKNHIVVYDNTSTWTINYNNNWQSSGSIPLFGRKRNGDIGYFMTGYIYSAQIYNNDTIVRNFIPAKRISDNKVGMYDTVSNVFFTNIGNSNFISGPVVDALYE